MPRLHKREWIIALIAVLVTLTIGVPTGMALADPAPAAGTEEAPDNECDDILGTGTPEFMYCKWMAKTPREALDIVRFWARNDGQKLQDAVPYPGPVLFCMDQSNKGPGMQDCADKDQVLCKYDHDAGKYVCKDVDGNITKPPAKACQGGEFDCSGGAGSSAAPGDGGTRSGQATAAPDVQPDVTQMPVDDKSEAPPSGTEPSAPPTGEGVPNGPADPSAPPAADPTAD